MNAFEYIVAAYYHSRGYWIIHNLHVQLTKEEKRRIGKAKMPRPELDLVAYCPSKQELLVVECKSLVLKNHFFDEDDRGFQYLKLVNDPNRRKIVFHALRRQLKQGKFLAAGKLKRKLVIAFRDVEEDHRPQIQKELRKRDCEILWPDEIRKHLLSTAKSSEYEDEILFQALRLLQEGDYFKEQ